MSVLDLDPQKLLASDEPRLTIRARLKPMSGMNRIQPTGFPEIGQVIYEAPDGNGGRQRIAIVDSAPSMANHLEQVCCGGSFDPGLAPDLKGLPYVRCMTGPAPNKATELVVTSLTEGHRLASTYFLEGCRLTGGGGVAADKFETELHTEFGLRAVGKKEHLAADGWWKVFAAIFKYDPNSLVHGIMFPKWQIKIPRVLTAVQEAFGAERVTTSGVKFDKLGKTTSGQPIFSKEEVTADEVRATFVIDLALVRSFGRGGHGLSDAQKTLLVALALWKISKLLSGPFRFRSGCDLVCKSIVADLSGGCAAEFVEMPVVDIARHIAAAGLKNGTTDVYWPEGELFKAPTAAAQDGNGDGGTGGSDADDDSDESEG